MERLPKEIDLALISQPEHVYYFSGHMHSPTGLAHRAPSHLLITRDLKSTLILDGKAKPSPDQVADRVVNGSWDATDLRTSRHEATAQAARQIISDNSFGLIGIERNITPTTILHPSTRTLDLTPFIHELRQSKDPDEIAIIKSAIRIGESFHKAARSFIEPGLTEIELYARCLEAATRHASQPFVMMCDFASGPHLRQGGPPGDRTIQPGDNVMLDIFPYIDGYRCDITNTLNAGNKPTDDQLAAIEAAESALTASEQLAKPGISAGEIFEAQDNAIREYNKDWHLDHHAGHALGLEHLETPDFVQGNPTKLVEGAIITFEPGVYAPDFQGGRIEHNYLVTGNGLQRLSHHQLGLV